MFALEHQDSREIDFEWIALWMGAGFLLAAWAYPFWRDYYPIACPMKALAGIPCAFCGGTRAASAFAHGHFHEAVMFNPLVGIGSGFAGLYILYALFSVVTRQPRRIRLVGFSAAAPARTRLMLRVGVAIVVLSNWIYLIAVGR